MDEYVLTVRLEHQRPLEANDFGRVFEGLSREYSRYLSAGTEAPVPDELRLFVRKVRSGSIEVDLVALAPFALPFVEHASNLLQFGEYVCRGFDALLGRREPERPFEKQSLENTLTVLEPIAKDASSQIGLVGTVNGNVTYNVTVTSLEANAIQNRAQRELRALSTPVTGLHQNAVLFFYQARNDPKATTGDKGIIESVSSRPVKVVFGSDVIKTQILSSHDNPFRMAFVVDVAVETIEGRPVLYNVVTLHETFERPSEAA